MYHLSQNPVIYSLNSSVYDKSAKLKLDDLTHCTKYNDMMLSSIPTPAFLAALASAQQENPTKAAICAAKNAGLVIAIKSFCSKNNIVVPSDYATGAKNGAWTFSPNKYNQVSIDGSACKDKQYVNLFTLHVSSVSTATVFRRWVPQQHCLSQFYDMCAKGGAHGGKTQKFGTKGCQYWAISYEKHAGNVTLSFEPEGNAGLLR